MNYLFFSRIIYTLPFLIYCGLNTHSIFANQTTVLFTLLYLVVFLFSVFFFGISKKIIPTLLVHFIFAFEFYILATLATATGDHNILLFILLTSFYTIESLRNDSLNLMIHLFMFVGGFYYVHMYYGLSIVDYTFDFATIPILGSVLLCRAIMSMLESKHIVTEEVVKTKEVYVPKDSAETLEKLDKYKDNESILKRKISFYKDRAVELKKDIDGLTSEKKALEREYDDFYKQAIEQQSINKDIAKAYFVLMANSYLDLNRTLEDNINNVLSVALNATNAKYICLVTKEEFDEHGFEIDKPKYALYSSFRSNDVTFSDQAFVGTDVVKNNLREVIKTQKCVTVVNVDIPESLSPISHIILAPVMGDGVFKGVLMQCFDDSYQRNVHYYNLVLMIAYQIYSALKNGSLYRQAKDSSSIDKFTNTYNKAYLLSALPLIISNAYNYDTALGLVFIDIDYFKDVNDTYGHDKGDFVLQKVVAILKDHIRQTDMVFRFGGDEFVILFSGATKEQLSGFFSDVNEDIHNLGIRIKKGEEEKSLSVSMGAYIYEPKEDGEISSEKLLKLADNAVYVAKKGGKGRIHISE